MNIFQFEHIEYLWIAILSVIFYIIWLFFNWKDHKNLTKQGDEKLLKELIEGKSKLRHKWKIFLVNLSFIFLAIALANPQLGSKMEEVKREGIDLIIAIDISNSMLAQDIKPNRLERSKMAISKLINELRGDRLGIIAYTAQAYTLLPITTDYGAARMFLNSVNTDYINQQGTSIAAAIELAQETFAQSSQNQTNKRSQAIIIISDGEDHESGAVEAARKAKENGITIYTIGMGLSSGAPIPVSKNNPSAGYKKDNQGNTIITKLNETLLEDIAKTANGYFIRASNSNTGLDKIYKSINSLDKAEIETRSFKEYEGWFQIFAIIAFTILLFEALIGLKKGKLESRFKILN